MFVATNQRGGRDSMSSEKILVTGATGQLGARIVHQLLRKLPADHIVAGGRSATKAPQGVEFKVVDYDKPNSIEAALDGVTRVVLVSGNEIGKRVAQHRAVIDAAVRAGVRLLAYTSILRAKVNPLLLAIEHRGTEEALSTSGLPFILLRNGWYSENYTAAASLAIRSGVVQSASGDGLISSASRDDYAEGAATLILRDDHKPGQAYELAGSTSFTKREYAALLSHKAGKKVVVQELTESQYAAALAHAGLPDEFAAILADSDAGSGDGWLFDDGRALEKAISRSMTPLEQTLDAALTAM
jgi:NAD(P)H dehydrogenase (quinone)